MLSKECLNCGLIFSKPYTESKKNWLNRHKFCSRHCVNLFQKGKLLKNIDYKSRIPWNKDLRPAYLQGKNHPNWKEKIKKVCPTCKKVFFVKPSLNRVTYCSQSCARTGKEPWNKGKKTGLIPKTVFKEGLIPWNKNKKGVMPTPWNKNIKFEAIRARNHWNWKGGKPKVTRKQELLSYKEYRQYRDWQKSVFQRDNYTCQMCKITGGELHADHIKQYALYPKLRWKITNGRTLCASCHRKTDTYGKHIGLDDIIPV